MTAHAHNGAIGYEVVDHDGDGIGTRVVTVYNTAREQEVEQAARLLVIARNLSGGWPRAIELLRAQLAKEG
jgi:hypothetical protein